MLQTLDVIIGIWYLMVAELAVNVAGVAMLSYMAVCGHVQYNYTMCNVCTHPLTGKYYISYVCLIYMSHQFSTGSHEDGVGEGRK